MPAVKALDRIVRKWITNAGNAGAEYEAGIGAPRTPWAAAAVAAGGIYRSEVTRAASEGRFESGVQAAGDSKWQSRAKRLGPGRFAEGVSVAAPEYTARFGQIRSAIEGTTLPAKGPKGSPAAVQRFQTMRDALIVAGRALRGGRAR